MVTYCKKCLLPTTYLNIKIDNDGVCQFCNNYSPLQYQGTEQLIADIQQPLSLNKSKKYDCVVGFSGGRDSTYLLWYVVKILKLKPLAVFSDDLFIPEITLQNIEKTCEILGVELRSIKHNNLKKCIKHHLKAWLKRPVPETLMFINVGERIGYETLVEKEAIKEGVKLIFGGRTPIQEHARYKTDLMKIGYKGGRIAWIFGYLKQVMLNPALATNLFCLKTQYKEFMVTWWKKRLIKKYTLTIIHPFFNYIEWKEKDIENVLFNELEWKLPPKTKNSDRIGCEVDTLRQYLYLKTLNYNDINIDLSVLIRQGQITKAEAEKLLLLSQSFSEKQVNDIVKKVGIEPQWFFEKLEKQLKKRNKHRLTHYLLDSEKR